MSKPAKMMSIMLALAALQSFACTEHKVQEVKQFSIYVDNKDQNIQVLMSTLVDDFNEKTGSHGLRLTLDRESSNSLIRFETDMMKKTNRLGIGQWIVKKEAITSGTIEKKAITTYQYGMDLRFDLENIKAKGKLSQDKDSLEYQHLFHLFAHEVGHGLLLEHSLDSGNVMFGIIPERDFEKFDYEAYFAYVREFFK